MKRLFTSSIHFTWTIVFFLSFCMITICANPLLAAPSDFSISILNITQPTDHTVEFDVYMKDMDATETFELGGVQLGFLLNSNIYAGGTLSASINNTGSGLTVDQQFTALPDVVSALTGYPNQTMVRLAPRIPPGSGFGTMISATGNGTLLTHFILTSTVPWIPNSATNLTFISSDALAPLYQTNVSQYVGAENTLLPVVPATNALVASNPRLNLGPPTIAGPATVGAGVVSAQVYTTEPDMTGYVWTVSSAGTIDSGAGTNSISVTWSNPVGSQHVTVSYNESSPANTVTTYNVLYYPFAGPIDATTIPQFVDPVPHFAAGLRVDAKAGGHLVIKAVEVQQIALSNGTPLPGLGVGTVVNSIPANGPLVGYGKYAAYAISKDGGTTFGPAMWPAQTIEAQQGNGLTVQYLNELVGAKYSDFNILADQTLMMNGFTPTGNPQTDPYTGDIPMVVHLHGGEMPSNSDGGPTAWFMPTGNPQKGPGFAFEASSLCTYPNMQEGTTLWYHPHDQGLTRINVYTGQAGFYFLRGTNEDGLHLPGWSGDGKVMEVTPAGKTPTFNGTNTYLPEIELAVQDRMFNNKGELYWPVTPTNPEVNPFWTPEFFGDVMTVNGKSWPYLSVAPRKYAFRLLNGCNARFLNLWLSSNPATGVNDGPPIKVIQTEGGLLDAPVTVSKVFIAPAERPTLIVDFTGYSGTYTLMNDANAPYPTGDPVQTGLTDRVMQFVVNGTAVGADNSVVPANLRPSGPMVKLTDFAGTLNVTPTVKRRLLLNEITGPGGPLRVAINNSHFDAATPAPGEPLTFGGPTEIPKEGTTEVWDVINTTVDAHPMHIHLTQWQLVSRRPFDAVAYMNAYAAAWATTHPGVPPFPSIAAYPGGAGSPYDYNTPDKDGYLGGNPAVSDFWTGPAVPALPEEMGWKDAIKAYPGEVATYIARYAPTDKPVNATPQQLVYPFDPSLGPGYVWHCHIIDHEDMDMMRPLVVQKAAIRFPVITTQPADLTACSDHNTSISVIAESINAITYQWQLSTDGGTTWNNLTEAAPYSNVTSATLNISPASILMDTYKYKCVLTNSEGVVPSAVATLTVLPSPAPTITGNAVACLNSTQDYSTEAGMTGYVWSVAGGTINSGDGTAIINVTWNTEGAKTVSVNYAGTNGCTAATPTVYNVTVNPLLPVSVSIAASANPTDPGTSVTLTATPTNGGDTPSYQWKVNGTNVGTDSPTYTYTPAKNDVVTCVLTSNLQCVSGNPATSNSVMLLLNETLNLSNLFLGGLYAGTSSMSQAFDGTGPHWPISVADHITVELHDEALYSTIVFTANDVPLSVSGTATVTVPGTYYGNYYITIKHRNSIETTTKLPVSFATNTINQSFGLNTDIHGNNLKQMFDLVYAIFSGDINQDGAVDLNDMLLIDNDSRIYSNGYLVTDVNGDGDVDLSDMVPVDNNSRNYVHSSHP